MTIIESSIKISQWKKIEKRELNGRRLQEVTPTAKKCFSFDFSQPKKAL